jgi:hypothetical protein
MALTNNAVTVNAGLICTVLTSPAIGSGGTNASIGYTDGDLAEDIYTNIIATSSPGTALHADLAADGFVAVYNPTTGQSVTLEAHNGASTVKLGTLPAGFGIVLPVSSGTQIKGYVTSGTQTVGVTAIKTTANA